MCGGDIELNGNGTPTCQYCGTTQIVPVLLDEKKINLLNRAKHYRSIYEYAKECMRLGKKRDEKNLLDDILD